LALQGKAKAEERERTQQELQQKIDHLGLILPDRQAVEVKIAEAGAEVQALKEKAAQNTAALDDLRKKAEADAKRLSDLEAVSQRGEGLEAELQSARGLGEQLLGQVKTLAEQLDQGLEAAALGVSPEAPEFMEVLKKALGESQKAYAQQLEHKEKTLREAQNLNEALAALESQRNLRTQDVISFKAEAQKAESAFETALKTEALALSDYKQYRDLSRASLTAQAAALKNYEFEVKETAGRVEELEAELLDKTPMDLAEGEAQRENLRTEEEALRERLEAVHRRLEINRRQCEKLGELSERLTQAEKQLGICQQLDETLKGTVKGKAKISFERYILSAYLQDILESANVFLEDMSAGRYRLEVMTEGGGRGLDIEVVDAYTGLKRSANTLSGGETFMAALSMALGLSDSVQSAAGGISLETIFIDEGFATLDPEALDKAISCLLAIKDDGRMVGLISHVEELKERIDTKITVTKTESGSHIEY
ncbi:MAG: SbcC/MukB-like Walker B domain-containing protein, partial [Eubacterium sp.]|nr:SbcC/MukB-like Walker B domain-containing protein [Eubacterium sp.]